MSAVTMIELCRGGLLESAHQGHAVICDEKGEILEAWGDPDAVIFPRSSCKMIQALPLLESGAPHAAGLRVENDLRGQSLKSQMRRSDSLGSGFALVLGESEVAAGTVQVKDLRASTQVELPLADVAAAIHTALAAL